MESLFARHTPKKGRVVLMLVGSLLVHGGLVGIGALLVQPPPSKVDVDWYLPEVDGPSPFIVADPVEQQTVADAEPTAKPELVDTSDSIPPPVVDEPVFAEPSSPTPRQRAFVKPTLAVRTPGVRASSSVPAVPSGAVPGGLGGNPAAGAASWVMPHPPYPAAVRKFASASGSTTVRVTTDATGRISNVVIVRSAGNAMLDAYTVSYVREHWRGPSNTSRTTEFLYQLR